MTGKTRQEGVSDMENQRVSPIPGRGEGEAWGGDGELLERK